MAEAFCNHLLIDTRSTFAHNQFAYIEEHSYEPLLHYVNFDLLAQWPCGDSGQPCSGSGGPLHVGNDDVNSNYLPYMLKFLRD